MAELANVLHRTFPEIIVPEIGLLIGIQVRSLDI